jgi:hypothetical protein
MNTNMESQTQQQTIQGTQRQAAADTTPVPAPASPEQLVDQLRVVRQQFGDLPVLTLQQRKNFRGLVRTTNTSVQSSINIIGASDTVSMAVGQPATQVQAMVTEANRWTAVEDELRAMLTSISDANLKRRHEIALVTAQAYAIGTQLARKAENGGLQPHLKEIKRFARPRTPEEGLRRADSGHDAGAFHGAGRFGDRNAVWNAGSHETVM